MKKESRRRWRDLSIKQLVLIMEYLEKYQPSNRNQKDFL